MKLGKAAAPSNIVPEHMKASGEIGIKLITDLANAMIRGEQAPQDWERSFIVNFCKGKGDVLLRGNYRGLKLLDQRMKVCERIINTIIREQVNIDSMQFGFMEARGTTDAIFILRQLQEKHINARKNLYFASVDLEKAFDRVPRQVIWWAMRKLGVQEWLISWIQSFYRGARSSMHIRDTYSEEFQVKVGVHQGSVLSPLLFIMVLEALLREFCTGCPRELFYADDLVIKSKTLNELLVKLKTWKKGNGGYRTEGKHDKNQTHDKWTGTQPTTGLRQIPLRRLPQRSWQ